MQFENSTQDENLTNTDVIRSADSTHEQVAVGALLDAAHVKTIEVF